jgi:hypothetical protein
MDPECDKAVGDLLALETEYFWKRAEIDDKYWKLRFPKTVEAMRRADGPMRMSLQYKEIECPTTTQD